MGRFDFKSPGAAFVDEITQVLAERKAEERQRMLDQIQQSQEARAERESGARLENMEFTRGLQTDQALRDRLSFLAGNLDKGDMPENIDPALVEGMQQYGMVRPQQGGTPVVSTDISGMSLESGEPLDGAPVEPLPQAGEAPPPRLGFVGSKEERDREANASGHGALIASLVNSGDKTKQAIGQVMQIAAQANRGVVPENLMNALLPRLGPGTPTKIFSPDSGRFIDGPEMAPGTEIINRGRAPRDLTPKTDPVVGRTAEGYNIYKSLTTGKEYIGETRTGPAEGEGPLGVPVGLLNEHRSSISLISGDDVAPEDVENFRYTAINIINAAKTANSKVKELATSFVVDPVSGTERMKELVMQGQLTEEEGRQLNQLLSTTRANQFRQRLIVPRPPSNKPPIANPPITNPRR